MRGISWFVDILRDRSKLLRLKLTNLFPNINFSGEKDSGKVLIIIIILFLIIITSETGKTILQLYIAIVWTHPKLQKTCQIGKNESFMSGASKKLGATEHVL